MNLPNKITLSRIFIVPIFMLFIIPVPEWLINSSFINKYGNYIAAVIFIIAASTDSVDGYIARKRKQITRFGKFLDPIADKLLVTAALIALVQRNEVNAWAAMVIIGRDLIVTGLRLVAAGEGVVIAASAWGKIKTIIQIIAIAATLLDNFPISLITDFQLDSYMMLVAVLITIYSCYDYIKKNIHFIDYDK